MAFIKAEYCDRCGTLVSTYFEPDDRTDTRSAGVWYRECRTRCTRVDIRRVGRATS